MKRRPCRFASFGFLLPFLSFRAFVRRHSRQRSQRICAKRCQEIAPLLYLIHCCFLVQYLELDGEHARKVARLGGNRNRQFGAKAPHSAALGGSRNDSIRIPRTPFLPPFYSLCFRPVCNGILKMKKAGSCQMTSEKKIVEE